MSDTIWEEVAAVFADALECDEAARPLFIEARCAGRPDVRAEVLSMLAAHTRLDAFMLHPTMAADPPAYPLFRPGDMVGAFRLVEEVGRGGMGTVYRAERADGAFVQQVAVKVVRAAIGDEDSSRRFRAERQILASLNHPHIVRLLDGGVTPRGDAYLVMEYVDGLPITRYCTERSLRLRARLALFRQVCDAVQYAHAHAIVHRDLKPDNVLVTPDGVPKILDFGVAKLLEQPGDASSMPTQAGVGPLTPNYASPEQIRGMPVTTASDVYTLGIILFQMLSGARPYETAGKPYDVILRDILDRDTPRPSVTEPAADQRPPYDPTALRGDLDAITLRALRKEAGERYASADALAREVDRFLDGAPVEARPPSFGYVLRKLASRHRVAFAAAAVSAVVVLLASGVAVFEARSAAAERRKAERRFDDVRALANSLIFSVHDAVAPLPGSTPVRQLIVREGLTYLERLVPDAAGDTKLRIELGRAYLQIGSVQGRPNVANLGDREGALSSFRRARELLAPAAHAPGAPTSLIGNYVDAIRFESEILGVIGSRKAEALAAARAAVTEASAAAATRPDDDDAQALVAAAEFALAIAVGKPDSLPHWTRAGAVYERLLARRPNDAGRQRNAALVEKYLGNFFEEPDPAVALSHDLRALALDQARYDAAPANRAAQLDLAIDLGAVASLQWRQGHTTEAAASYERSLALREEILKRDPTDRFALGKVAFSHRQLGAIRKDVGDFSRALVEFRRAIQYYEAAGLTLMEERRSAAWCWSQIASIGGERGSCDAWGRSFRLFAELTEPQRLASVTIGVDPLVKVAKQAAACGTAHAAEWVRAHTSE